MDWKNLTELKKTMTFGGVAAALALLALVTAPRRITPKDFVEAGEAFFPEFKDPTVATSLEVVSFDEATASAVPFKVELKDGKWSIPSHYDYPADGKERLAKTAASVIDIKKDDVRSENVSDHAACGVIDPLDDKATSLQGRGTRVTLKGATDNVLADFIVGKQVKDREGFRFVRVPGQKRVYAVRMNIDLSTKFGDWIESDLLLVNKDEVEQITLKDYSVDERRGTLNQRDVVVMNKKEGKWAMNNIPGGQELDESKVTSLLTALDELSIVGVRPKPAGLTQSLEKSSYGLNMEDMQSLQSKGYYFAQNGQLFSNEGEMQARTKEGVIYTLRFGEVAYGTGLAVSAGLEDSNNTAQGPGENRYLFITTAFDPKTLPPAPPQPKNADFMNKPDSLFTDADRANKEVQNKYDEWKKTFGKGEKSSQDLNKRFAKWYYVISQASFDKVHLARKDFLKTKS
jgi:hypothetical protein